MTRTYMVTVTEEGQTPERFTVQASNPADAVTSAPHGHFVRGYTWIKERGKFYAVDHLSGRMLVATATAAR